MMCLSPCFRAQDPGEWGREPEPWEAVQGAVSIWGVYKGDAFHDSSLFSFQPLNLKVRASNSFLLLLPTSFPTHPASLSLSTCSPLSSSF